MPRRFPLPPPAALLLPCLAACGCGAKEEPPVTSAPAAVAPAEPAAGAATAADADPVDWPAKLAGTYERESYGQRTLTVREDGTATMAVDVDPFYRWMTGPKVTVEIAWELTDSGDPARPGVHFESVSGTPEASFEAVTKLFGSERDWLITAAGGNTLELLDPEDADETVVWERTAE